MVSYVIIVGDTFESLVGLLLDLIGVDSGSTFAKIISNRRVVIAALVLLIIMPLCFLRDITTYALSRGRKPAFIIARL